MKKIICILLAFMLVVPCASAAEDAAADTASIPFTKAEKLLKGLNLLARIKNPEDKIKRAEFASYILGISGEKNIKAQDSSDKYTGFSNDEEDKDWEWIDESEQASYPQATYFYDVTNEHEYWNDINTVAKLGLMTGDDDRHFRPDEYITENEALKVLVCMLNGEFSVRGNNILGYVTAAQNLSLLKNIKSEEILTYKNMTIYFYNLLHTKGYEPYEIEKGNITYRRSDDTYMYETFGIEKTEGIVDANGITRLDGGSSYSKGTIEIDGERYFGDADNFIGMNVTVYYTEDSGDKTVKYIYADKNEIVKVDAEDIQNYSAPKLYFEKNGKTDDLYIGAKTNIIYNGKALTNYNDSLLTPSEGSVTFINADGDSEYETVCIEDIKTIVTGSVDTLAQKIYNKLKTPEVYELDGKKLVIKSSDGTDMTLSNIAEDSVLSIRTTLAAQGEKNIEITVSNRIVKGKIVSVTEDDITIGENVYSLSSAAQKSQFEVSKEGSFYLDASDKVVWYKPESSLKYGYLMTAASKEGMSDEWEMKVYTVQGEFKVLPIAEKVKLNGVRLDAAKAMKEKVINNGISIISQMIKYSLDEKGSVNEILTADADKDKFAVLYSGDELDAVFRNGGNYKSFNVDVPICYADDETVIMNVPITNKLDENSYYIISQEHDKYYKLRYIYGDSSDSAIGKVVVTLSDVVSSSTPNGKAGIVKSIVKSYMNDEEVYDVTVLGESGEKRFYVNDEKLLDEAAEIKNGDIVRFVIDAKGYASYIGKVFDSEKMAIADSALKYSGYATKNPLATGTGYVSNFHLLHGKIISTKDAGEYLAVAPFEYEKQTDGSYAVQDSVQDKQFMLKRNICKIYTYDSVRKKLLMSNQDIITADVAGLSEATEAVICSFWGTAYIIVLYK